MLLGLQPAIAEENYCVFMPLEDNAAADTNSTQYRKGIMDYYNSMKENGNSNEVKITNEDNNCVLHIEPYNPVKRRTEKVPIISVSHDRTKGEERSKDDPYQFFLIPDGNKFTDAAISYMGKLLGGKENLKGKTITTLSSPDYGNDDYLSEKDFTHDSITIYDSHEQQDFIWSYISKHEPIFVLLRGKGVNISSAIKNADEFYYPVSKLIGDAWAGHNKALIDLGEIADGYQTLSAINAITNNTYWELLGRLAAVVSLEAIDFAKEEFGAELNRGQVRWALENLDLSQNDLRKIGIENLVSPIKMDCNNRNIFREIYIQEWDADDKKWKVIDNVIDENDGEEREECREKDLNTILSQEDLVSAIKMDCKRLNGEIYIKRWDADDRRWKAVDEEECRERADKKLEALDNLREAKRKTLDYANLSNIDLTRVDLTGVDLTKANFTGANLYGVDLTEANLYGVDLTGANLYGVDLTEANLYGADLTGANLYGADLTGTNLYGADLTGANLTEAAFSNTTFTRERNPYDVKGWTILDDPCEGIMSDKCTQYYKQWMDLLNETNTDTE